MVDRQVEMISEEICLESSNAYSCRPYLSLLLKSAETVFGNVSDTFQDFLVFAGQRTKEQRTLTRSQSPKAKTEVKKGSKPIVASTINLDPTAKTMAKETNTR